MGQRLRELCCGSRGVRSLSFALKWIEMKDMRVWKRKAIKPDTKAAILTCEAKNLALGYLLKCQRAPTPCMLVQLNESSCQCKAPVFCLATFCFCIFEPLCRRPRSCSTIDVEILLVTIIDLPFRLLWQPPDTNWSHQSNSNQDWPDQMTI